MKTRHLAEIHSGKREAISTSAALQEMSSGTLEGPELLFIGRTVKNREEASVGYENPWWEDLGEATTDFLCSAGVSRRSEEPDYA